MIDQVNLLRKKVERYGWFVGYRVRAGDKRYIYVKFRNSIFHNSKLDRYAVTQALVTEVFPTAKCTSFSMEHGASYRVN